MKIKPDVNSLIHITSTEKYKNYWSKQTLKQQIWSPCIPKTVCQKLENIWWFSVIVKSLRLQNVIKLANHKNYCIHCMSHFFLCECLRYLFPFLLIIIHKAPFQMFQQYAFLLVFLSSLFRISFVPHVITTEVCSSKNHQYVY